MKIYELLFSTRLFCLIESEKGIIIYGNVCDLEHARLYALRFWYLDASLGIIVEEQRGCSAEKHCERDVHFFIDIRRDTQYLLNHHFTLFKK